MATGLFSILCLMLSYLAWRWLLCCIDHIKDSRILHVFC